MVNIELLTKEIELLLNLCEKDYSTGDLRGYDDHIDEFNRILASLISELDYLDDIEPISHVPPSKKSRYVGEFSSHDYATLKEVIMKSKKVLIRLPKLINKKNPEKILVNIFSKFQRVSRQLNRRYDSRETIKIEDEYDVQDLLYALLVIFFDDIRPEEYTPSFGSGSRRMDFLLKNEKIVIEVKKTRQNLRDVQISKELNDDINTYKEHNDCDALYCFIYDPDGFIRNPNGLKADLEKQSVDQLEVKVFIYPD